MSRNIIRNNILSHSVIYLCMSLWVSCPNSLKAQELERNPAVAKKQKKVEEASLSDTEKTEGSSSMPSLESPSGKKVDFSAKDVWDNEVFKDPSNKVLVIQDRAFTKAGKFEVGLDGGLISSSPFYNSYSYGAHATYNFSEYWGIDAFYNHMSSTLTADGQQIQDFLTNSGFSSTKEFQEPKWFTGLGIMWSPIYGKFAFFNKNIIHFDIFALAGISFLNTASNVVNRGGKDQTCMGSLLGLGMRFFFSRHWSMRVDVKNNIYSSYFAQNVNNGTGAGTNVLRNSFQYTLGFEFMFGRNRD